MVYEIYTNQERREASMNNTALSATHMVNILSQFSTEIKPLADRRRGQWNCHAASSTPGAHLIIRDPGGGEMVKVRLQGTKEDICKFRYTFSI